MLGKFPIVWKQLLTHCFGVWWTQVSAIKAWMDLLYLWKAEVWVVHSNVFFLRAGKMQEANACSCRYCEYLNVDKIHFFFLGCVLSETWGIIWYVACESWGYSQSWHFTSYEKLCWRRILLCFYLFLLGAHLYNLSLESDGASIYVCSKYFQNRHACFCQEENMQLSFSLEYLHVTWCFLPKETSSEDAAW